MASYKNVAIVGASGNIGKIILDGLIASSRFDITVLARETSTATFPASITVRKIDFSDPSLDSALQGQDVLISALGATGFGEQQKLVDAALRAGVKRFLPSEFSASSEDEAVLQLLPLFGQKKALIDYLKTKESEGLTWTGVAVGPLFDWGLLQGFLEYDLTNRTATIWDGGDKKFTLTNEKQLGQAVVSVLEKPEDTKNRFVYVYTSRTSQNELLASLEKASGAKWTVKSTTTEEQIAEAGKKLGAGDFSGAFILVRAAIYGNTPGLGADYSENDKLANELLEIKIESVDETVKRVLSK